MQSRHHLATLTFDGPHYADHGLDLDDLQELAAYRKIVVETAIELWRRHNPGRDRLPKGFEEGIVLKFYQLTAGSATVPIERVVDESGQDVPFRIEDEVEEAAEIIDHALAAASEDSAPPVRLPASVVPMIQKWGETLRPGSSMLLQSCRSPLSVRHDGTTRSRMAAWCEKIYEDTVKLEGEVRLADIDGRRFAIRLDDGRRLEGRFSPEHESQVVEALVGHRSLRLLIEGRAEFSRADGSPRRIISTTSLVVREIDAPDAGPSGEKPLWEQIVEIGGKVSEDEWVRVPPDLSINVDHYLYGAPRKEP